MRTPEERRQSAVTALQRAVARLQLTLQHFAFDLSYSDLKDALLSYDAEGPDDVESLQTLLKMAFQLGEDL